ncbi:MAG: helix-turn-helix domain-containing protein, partial [Candidatus Rokuibacteriota bacterium]
MHRSELPQLAAHKGLRGDILLELKRAQPLAARELAARLGVSPNAVRHHLKELEAERLVLYGREQRGVGAPTYAYRLAPAGEALFP